MNLPNADAFVILTAVFAAGFLVGLGVGDEKAAAELRPCPVVQGKAIISRTKDVCTYIKASQWQGKYQVKL